MRGGVSGEGFDDGAGGGHGVEGVRGEGDAGTVPGDGDDLGEGGGGGGEGDFVEPGDRGGVHVPIRCFARAPREACAR